MARMESKNKKLGGSSEAKNALVERAGKALAILKRLYPCHGTALKHGSVFQLSVAVILSAQCTDAMVNIVARELFKKLKSPEDFAAVPQGELEKLIYSTGFYRAKAKNLRAMAKALLEKHDGTVPKTMGELVKLHGIGRKTANIILSEGYGIAEGIAVDTHVKRLSVRLGFSRGKTPERIERDLMALLPKKDWGEVNGLLIMHGRGVCTARKPKCAECVLNRICPSAFMF
ncbi:G/T mismatches repair enzyme [uncultured archaeon]|nr:G/T mismatches repair enzyme [uncultured archaeon]